MLQLGEYPGDRALQTAFGSLIGDASALRSLVSLDAATWLCDDDVAAHVGSLAVAVCQVACVLGVDLAQAMTTACDAADERIRARAALLDRRRQEVPT